MKWVDQTKRHFAAVRLIAYIIAGVVTIFCIGMLTSLYAHALEDPSPSWLAGTPSFLSETESIRQTGVVNDCTPTYVTVAGGSQGGYKCLVQGEDMAIDDNLTSISIGLDKKQYKVNGMGPVISEYSRRNFVPSSNMLITRSGYTFVTYSATLTIESNVLKSLRPVIGPTLAREYNYAYSPDFTLSDGSGPLNVARGLGYSQNGRWIVVEVMNLGLVRIDTHNNYRAELFSTLAPRYYVASNPQMALAISDDGSHAAVGGMNSPFLVYEISNTCTKVIDPDLIFSRDGYVGCPEKSLWEYKGSDQYSPYRLKFDADGYELKFVDSITHWSNCSGILQTRCEAWRTLRAPGYSDESKLDYLALGDSYSSGEGDIEDNSGYYLPSTNTDTDNCHISSRSFPYRLRDTYGIDLDKMRSIACSGAKVTSDYYVQMDNYIGQNNRLSKRSASEVDFFKQDALERFVPGRAPQLEFVKKYKPKVITVTGGGNDVGFGDILKYCAWDSSNNVATALFYASFSCGYADSGNELQKMLARAIHDQYEYNVALVKALKQASPNSKIYLLGYPQFISRGTAICTNSLLLNSAERNMLYEAVDYMNVVQKNVAKDTGAQYVDIADSLTGGRLCEGSEYMTGILDIGFDNTRQQEMFHPNAEGHRKIAETFRSSVGKSKAEFMDGELSDGERVSTGVSGYFGDITNVVQSFSAYIVDGAVTKERYINIGKEIGLLMSGAQATATIYSEPTVVGGGIVGDDGALSMDIVVPASVRPGYHMLTVSTWTYSGEPIRFYQLIEVVGSNLSDRDEDGVSDDKDFCGYMPNLNIDKDLDGVDDACDMNVNVAASSVELPGVQTLNTAHSLGVSPRAGSVSSYQVNARSEPQDRPVSVHGAVNIDKNWSMLPIVGTIAVSTAILLGVYYIKRGILKR